MKPIQSFFAGLAVLLMMGACAQSIGQPGPDVQSSATAIFTLTSASTALLSETVTPIPPPTRRLTVTVSPTVTFTPAPPSITPGGPTSEFSATPYPSLTAVPSITPTRTRFVMPPIGGGFGPTATPIGLACRVSAMYPPWGEVFTQRTDFMAQWRVFNTGRDQWRMDDIFFEYVEGAKMHSKDREETTLAFTVYARDKINLHVRMKTPKEPGYYTTTFGLRKSNKTEFFCTFSVTVNVVKKK